VVACADFGHAFFETETIVPYVPQEMQLMRLCVRAESSLPPPKLRNRHELKTVHYQQVGQRLSSLDFQVAHADQLAFVGAVAIHRVKAAKLCWCMLLNYGSRLDHSRHLLYG